MTWPLAWEAGLAQIRTGGALAALTSATDANTKTDRRTRRLIPRLIEPPKDKPRCVAGTGTGVPSRHAGSVLRAENYALPIELGISMVTSS
jgi:hypothetical protein